MPLINKDKIKATYLGLGKTIYNSNITELCVGPSGEYQWHTLLQERFMRKKWSGRWPMNLLEKIDSSKKKFNYILENRDITTPRFIEDLYQKESLFYELIQKRGLSDFCSQSNEQLEFVPHHIAHAYSAVAHMPFKSSFILVMDGGGNEERETTAFFKKNSDLKIEDLRVRKTDESSIEHTSLFFWNGCEMALLYREGLEYEEVPDLKLKLSDGIGSAYEKAAQLIFNDNLASGKVMGLAGFGRSFYDSSFMQNIRDLQQKFPWQDSFSGKDKLEWQNSVSMNSWQDIAATIQEAFEENLFRVFKQIDSLAKEHNLDSSLAPVVFTGGCALNCTANFKITKKSEREIYIPPCPGDEGISLGLAMIGALKDGTINWQAIPYENQRANHGINHEIKLEELTGKEYRVEKLDDLKVVGRLLKEGKVVAWFQGRSECGPRALGQRSLLVRPDHPNIKKYLNETIKFREDFRPYGASVLWERANKYFEVPKGFQNPFMSFATPIRDGFKELLREVSHVDGTCRMQTVMEQQNPSYHRLLCVCESLGMMPILLNTSLNIMGEPIVETPSDAMNFLDNSVVGHLVLGDYLITKVRPTGKKKS